PGCGKGTQATFIAGRFRIPAISTGEMFRSECKAGTKLGKLACSILSSGRLVPDEIVNQMLAARIAQADCRHGFLLDGYPRTVPQAKFLGELLESRRLDAPTVIHLDVPAEAERVAGADADGRQRRRGRAGEGGRQAPGARGRG